MEVARKDAVAVGLTHFVRLGATAVALTGMGCWPCAGAGRAARSAAR